MTANLGELRDLYQQTILERYKKPKFRGRTESVDLTSRGHNPSCGDTIELTVQLDETGETVAAVRFEGEGCAIALSSADLMAEALIGKSLDEALSMVRQFQGMMKGEGEFPHAQRKLNVMKGVAAFPVRIKCANLAWHTLRAAIENPVDTTSSGFISTESDS
jgi:nitrogen fixation protein NifU and related proteins